MLLLSVVASVYVDPLLHLAASRPVLFLSYWCIGALGGLVSFSWGTFVSLRFRLG